MTTGTIKSLVHRGFGFISPGGDSDKDVFFHSSVVAENGFERLHEGQQVSYEQEADPRDPSRQRATRVTPLATAQVD